MQLNETMFTFGVNIILYYIYFWLLFYSQESHNTLVLNLIQQHLQFDGTYSKKEEIFLYFITQCSKILQLKLSSFSA